MSQELKFSARSAQAHLRVVASLLFPRAVVSVIGGSGAGEFYITDRGCHPFRQSSLDNTRLTHLLNGIPTRRRFTQRRHFLRLVR
jgi:hypothetical protein